MNLGQFTKNKSGELVRVFTPEEDSAFIPDPLPANWKFPAYLWPLVAKARQALGELDGIGRTLPNPELLLRPLQRREALRSSSLEGTYSTAAQLYLFELQGKLTKPDARHGNPALEVYNYSKALLEGYDYLKERPLSLSLVRALHQWLLSDVRGHDCSPGEFRRKQVHIGSDRRYVPPPPEKLSDCLENLSQKLRIASGGFDPLVGCYITHYQFEAIHPFADGNGRVGRLLLALMTWLWCDLSMPWLYMSAYFDSHKDEYVNRLFNEIAQGDWAKWVEFCLLGTIEQARDAIRRCDQLKALKAEMHEKATRGSGRLHRIVEDLFSYPVLSIPMVQVELDVTYPTAKSDVQRLVKAGYLVHLKGSSHPKLYYAPGIFHIAYADHDENGSDPKSDEAGLDAS